MSGRESLKDVVDLIDVSRSTDRKTNYDLLKIIEDATIKDMLMGERSPFNRFAPLYPLFTPLNALTYLPGDNQVEARKAFIAAAVLIESCFVDERDAANITFLHSLELFGSTQAFDSRKGFKARTATEQKISVEQSGERPPEKKKFLGVF